MPSDPAGADTATEVESGAPVYDESGEELGVIREATDAGFGVAVDEACVDADDDRLDGSAGDDRSRMDRVDDASVQSSAQRHDPGKEFGEGYIVWRCAGCGEMGDLDDGLPTECPSCRTENVYKWRED